VFVYADPIRVKQLILNLLSNAIKFTKTGGKVALITQAVHSQDNMIALKLEVVDSGIGIRKAQQARIFDMFTQAEESTTRKFGGTGLGLYICKKLVDLMGGEIDVKSNFGHGATFWVKLKFRKSSRKSILEAGVREDIDESKSPPKENENKDKQINIENVKEKEKEKEKEMEKEKEKEKEKEEIDPCTSEVLMVEDNIMNQKIGIRLLTRIGFTKIVIANNGQEAIEIVAKRADMIANKKEEKMFAVILMDLHMPILDGVGASKRIQEILINEKIVAVKELRRLRKGEIAVVAMTADKREEAEEQCSGVGMCGFITKPVQLQPFKDLFTKLGFKVKF